MILLSNKYFKIQKSEKDQEKKRRKKKKFNGLNEVSFKTKFKSIQIQAQQLVFMM